MANVLIDTQVFRASGFNFDRPEWNTLRGLVESGEDSIFVTRIIDGEVRRQITEQSETAQTALRSTLKENQVLRHSPKVPFHELVGKGALADLTAIRIKQWEDWKAAHVVEELPAT